MTADKILQWAEDHKNDDWFEVQKIELANRKVDISTRLENFDLSISARKKYEKEYGNICEILHMISIMEHQRLVLFYKSRV